MQNTSFHFIGKIFVDVSYFHSTIILATLHMIIFAICVAAPLCQQKGRVGRGYWWPCAQRLWMQHSILHAHRRLALPQANAALTCKSSGPLSPFFQRKDSNSLSNANGYLIPLAKLLDISYILWQFFSFSLYFFKLIANECDFVVFLKLINVSKIAIAWLMYPWCGWFLFLAWSSFVVK